MAVVVYKVRKAWYWKITMSTPKGEVVLARSAVRHSSEDAAKKALSFVAAQLAIADPSKDLG